MAVSMTLRNTFLEVADAPKRRARASTSPDIEDSCGETTVPSEHSGGSGDELFDVSGSQDSWGSPLLGSWASPAVGAAASPRLPWPSTPDFLPQYGPSQDLIPTLPPCAEEDLLLPEAVEAFDDVEAAALWEAWSQMYWSESEYGFLEQSVDASLLYLSQAGLSAAWTESQHTQESKEKTPILPRQSKNPIESAVPRTTLMLKNMPNNQTRKMLLEILNRHGFELRYDFVYLPYDFQTGASLGYAFVNFLTPDAAQEAFEKFDGFASWSIPSRKVCGVGWSEPHQGLEAHIERYRDSPVMHHEVPEKFKPLILENGAPVPFPAPTKKLRAPRMRGL